MRPPNRERWKPWVKRGDQVKSIILEFLKDEKNHRSKELNLIAAKNGISPPTLVKHLKKLVARGVIVRDEVTRREVYYRLQPKRMSAIFEMALIDFKNRLTEMLDNPEKFDHRSIIRYVIREGLNIYFHRHRGTSLDEGEFVATLDDRIIVARFDDYDWSLMKEGLNKGSVVGGRFNVMVQAHKSMGAKNSS